MFLKIILITLLFYGARCKNNIKSLTDTMGQEIIEIGAQEKDLPPGVEEEPQHDVEEKTQRPIPLTTKRESKRMSTVTLKPTEKKPDPPKEDTNSEEEEMKIEKEFADIYKDTDYKSETEVAEELKESSQVTTTGVSEAKPALRLKSNFKFQPDSANKAEIEKFRTSVDEISCDKRVTQRLSGEVRNVDAGSSVQANVLFILLATIVHTALY